MSKLPIWHMTNIGLLLLIAFLWASAFGAMKVAVVETGPVSLAAIRASIASVILLCLLRMKGPIPWRFLIEYFPHFLIVGGLGTALPFVLLPWVELRIDSSLAGLLMSVGPLATMAGAWLFGLERDLNMKRVFGIFVGLAGTMVIFAQGFASLGQGYLGAQFVAVGASLCYVAGNLMVRRLDMIAPFVIATLAMTLAACLLVPMAIFVEQPTPLQWSAQSWQMLLWLGLMPTALAFSVRYYLIARAGASFTSYVGYLIPAIAMLLGALLLDEVITLDKLLALGLILTGLLFAQQQGPSPSRAPIQEK